MKLEKLELLSPAANAEIAIEAIKHGADAIYMGGPMFGARKAAFNSLDDIAKVVDFAHRFRAKVYVTVNTIIYDREINDVEEMCRDLYHIGVDALIVQDLGLIRMKLPPIALHASTQCDIRTPEKARFLEQIGFSQLVLARELTLKEIKEISGSVSIPLEFFVHGALCVSYSGRCHASFAINGRSANRGECAQLCRLPYTLKDPDGKIVAKDKYLLSLRDLNNSHNIPDLIESGISSFKIEGRLKEIGYVKNITAFYNNLLDDYITCHKDKFRRSSDGKVKLNFLPNPHKSFNRDFTDYFLNKRKPPKIASLLTPKSLGEPIKEITDLHNGDGVSFFDKNGIYQGVNINGISNGKIIPARKINIPDKINLYRTNDIEWNKTMKGSTSVRKLSLDISVDKSGVTCEDERGVKIRLPLNVTMEKAKFTTDIKKEFSKLGNTDYELNSFRSYLGNDIFIPNSQLSALRRQCVELLYKANKTVYPYEYRRNEDMNVRYPFETLDYRDNVANHLAISLYKEHGVKKIEKALEISGKSNAKGKVVMTTRHCILRELGLCGTAKDKLYELISDESLKFKVKFNCNNCEMEIIK